MCSRRRRSRLLALVALLALVSCANDQRVVEIVVPEGTADQLARGETVDIMPAEIRMRVGDTLRIRNKDAAGHEVGPYVVAAGKEFELTYGAPGRFEGICPLSGGERYLIEITE